MARSKGGIKPTFRAAPMFPSEYLEADDLRGKDVTVTIANVSSDIFKLDNKTQERKFMLSFEGKKKKLILNKTNGKTIAKLHGKKAEDWSGKPITLYPTTCEAFGATVDCIRVRESAPKATAPANDDFDDEQDDANGNEHDDGSPDGAFLPQRSE